jgi:hypothetical protein
MSDFDIKKLYNRFINRVYDLWKCVHLIHDTDLPGEEIPLSFWDQYKDLFNKCYLCNKTGEEWREVFVFCKIERKMKQGF